MATTPPAAPPGTITLADVNATLGFSPTAAITLNDTVVRRLAAARSPIAPFLTAGSQISMNDLRGKATTLWASGGSVPIVATPTHNIHIFTSPGTFTVSYAFPNYNTVDYMVVAGGGAGGRSGPRPGTLSSPTLGPGGPGGAGGAGGFRIGTGYVVSASPGTYPITVGGGGAPSPSPSGGKGGKGSDSTFDTITSTGGGGGAAFNNGPASPGYIEADPGGSGGGAGEPTPSGRTGGLGNSPPVSPSQGNPGGNTGPVTGGCAGGGGAGAAGGRGYNPGDPPSFVSGTGGIGAVNPWSPSSYGEAPPTSPTTRYFAGGGGSGPNAPTRNANDGRGGLGGGGNSQTPLASPPLGIPAKPGTVNTGGGGGGSGPNEVSGSGGSGIVMIRYSNI